MNNSLDLILIKILIIIGSIIKPNNDAKSPIEIPYLKLPTKKEKKQ